MNPTKPILLNRIITPDGTVMVSAHQHDYVTYVDSLSDEKYMVDGGTAYLRRNVCIASYTEASLYYGDDHEILRESITWGSYGKPADYSKPPKRIKIADLEEEHIKAIVSEGHGSAIMRLLMEDELSYRAKEGLL